MARDDLFFRLRIPEELKRRVFAAARANDRSMTAEINARLEGTFSSEDVDPSDTELVDIVADLERLKRRIIQSRQPK
ncbi:MULTISPECIES: Arc family DNA-binding protein [unclassified Rhizobium]|uniref:Arc family DNA-binding protein n=1 Tax=unclassified Rhizobium TaxID=2613769 RepID=UPI000B52FF80|nr:MULTISPECIES: Arc family DNA-binding protein [unclassified Rhizobium]